MNRAALIHFLIALSFAFLMLAGYVFLFLSLSSARAGAAAARAEVARMEHEDATLADAEDALAKLAADETLLRSYFVSTSGVVAFLERIERSGDALQSVVEVVSVTEPKEEGGRLMLSVRITGDFRAVMKTLGSLEYGPYDIQVDSLTLDTVPSDDGEEWVAATTFTVATIEETP
jgi:hypothetical protein